MEINERIFFLLEQEGKKASALAAYLNIKPSSITSWKNEGSYPSSKYIQKISEFLNVSVNYLITGEEDSKYANENILNSAIVHGNNSKAINGDNFEINKNTGINPLSEQQKELIRIYNSLSVRKQIELMSLAYKMEEEIKAWKIQK